LAVIVETSVDFIERWFGFSPDGGDGSTELIYILAPAVLLALFVGRRRLTKLFVKTGLVRR
jgi:MYXO-CTERM domain-containing protein